MKENLLNTIKEVNVTISTLTAKIQELNKSSEKFSTQKLNDSFKTEKETVTEIIILSQQLGKSFRDFNRLRNDINNYNL